MIYGPKIYTASRGLKKLFSYKLFSYTTVKADDVVACAKKEFSYTPLEVDEILGGVCDSPVYIGSVPMHSMVLALVGDECKNIFAGTAASSISMWSLNDGKEKYCFRDLIASSVNLMTVNNGKLAYCSNTQEHLSLIHI